MAKNVPVFKCSVYCETVLAVGFEKCPSLVQDVCGDLLNRTLFLFAAVLYVRFLPVGSVRLITFLLLQLWCFSFPYL